MKSWNDLTITDDFIFCKVMQNEVLCKQMVEVLLNIKIEKLQYIEPQHSIAPEYASRSIRLDIYVKDSDRVYDIEIQTTNKRNLEKRARYYQSLMDIDQLEHNVDYNSLKDSYIIFICTFDPFKEDSLTYTITQTIKERPGVTYNDNTRKVFYNLKSSELKKEDSRLGNFLRYLKSNEPTDVFTNTISKEVLDVKHSVRWRKEYMTIGEKIDEEVAIELEKRLPEELEKRLPEELEKRLPEEMKKRLPVELEAAAIELLKSGVDTEIIAKATKLPIEKISELKNNL